MVPIPAALRLRVPAGLRKAAGTSRTPGEALEWLVDTYVWVIHDGAQAVQQEPEVLRARALLWMVIEARDRSAEGFKLSAAIEAAAEALLLKIAEHVHEMTPSSEGAPSAFRVGSEFVAFPPEAEARVGRDMCGVGKKERVERCLF